MASNELSRQTVIFTHHSNLKTTTYAKELLGDNVTLIDYADIQFTLDGLYTPDLVPIDLNQTRRLIFFPGVNTVFKKILVKYLRVHYPSLTIFNTDNIPTASWEWESKFEAFLAISRLAVQPFILPKTMLINYNSRLEDTVRMAEKYLGTYPLVMKPAKGSQGKGVELVTSAEVLRSRLTAIIAKGTAKHEQGVTGNNYILQEFINAPSRSDIRVIILNGKIVGGMQRSSSNKAEFRNNYSLGASISSYAVTDPDILAFVNNFYAKTKLFTVGFDFIRGNGDKLYLLELTTLPQSGGFDQVNKVNYTRTKLEEMLKD